MNINQYVPNIKYRYLRSIDISQIQCLKISLDPNSNVLVLQSQDYIYLMNIHQENIIGSFSAHHSIESNLPQFSNNSQYLAFISNQKLNYSIQIVSYTTHIFTYIYPPITFNKDSLHFDFHPKNDMVYFGMKGSNIYCYNINTRPLDVELLDIKFEQFRLIGNDILITIFEFKFNIWNIERMHKIKKYKMSENMRFNDLLLRSPKNYISPNFKQKHASSLYMISLQNYKIIYKITPDNLTQTALTHDGSRLICINYNYFELLDLRIRKVTQNILISNKLREVLFSQNEKLLLFNNLLNILIFQQTI